MNNSRRTYYISTCTKIACSNVFANVRSLMFTNCSYLRCYQVQINWCFISSLGLDFQPFWESSWHSSQGTWAHKTVGNQAYMCPWFNKIKWGSSIFRFYLHRTFTLFLFICSLVAACELSVGGWSVSRVWALFLIQGCASTPLRGSRLLGSCIRS